MYQLIRARASLYVPPDPVCNASRDSRVIRNPEMNKDNTGGHDSLMLSDVTGRGVMDEIL